MLNNKRSWFRANGDLRCRDIVTWLRRILSHVIPKGLRA